MATPSPPPEAYTNGVSATAQDQELPEGIYHYDDPDEVPEGVWKYWQQRYDIFSYYDDGIWMTDDIWFGVTPEPVATKIAEHVATAPASKTVLIDAFAGAGGNTIAFALSGRWKQIFAVEKDAKTLACAKHNAKVYGVASKITWIQGDVFDVLKTRLKSVCKNAVVFGSPPWGGPTYRDFEVFDLGLMEPYTLSQLHKAFSAKCDSVALYLPRTSDLEQIAELFEQKDDGDRLEVTHYCMGGASKALCAYYGPFAFGRG